RGQGAGAKSEPWRAWTWTVHSGAPRAVFVLDALAHADEEPILLVGQGPSAVAMELVEDLVHALLLGRLLGQPALAAQLRAPAPPAPQGALAPGSHLGPGLEAGVTLREVVAEEAPFLVVAPFLHHAGLEPDDDLDEDRQEEERDGPALPLEEAEQ